MLSQLSSGELSVHLELACVRSSLPRYETHSIDMYLCSVESAV